jgi:hypothetical protein
LNKQHFLDELKVVHSQRGPNLLSEADINKYIKKIKIQSEIVAYLKDIDSPDITPENRSATLFGSLKQRSDLAEIVLVHGNHDLGLGLVLNFQLPVTPILTKVVSTLVQRNQSKKVEEFIKRGRALLTTDIDWDSFIVSCIKTFVDAGQGSTASKLIECILN